MASGLFSDIEDVAIREKFSQPSFIAIFVTRLGDSEKILSYDNDGDGQAAGT